MINPSENLKTIVKTYRPIEELIPAYSTEGDILANSIRQHYYRTGGEKPPLLLLHGFNEYGLTWLRVAKELERDYDIIMLDARGHGPLRRHQQRIFNSPARRRCRRSNTYARTESSPHHRTLPGWYNSVTPPQQHTPISYTPSSSKVGVIKISLHLLRTLKAIRPGTTPGLPRSNNYAP